MKKIICFTGSPRPNGCSNRLVTQAIAGMESVGAEIIVYDLNHPEVKGCQGCNYCRRNEGCATKDDYLAPMYEDIKNADSILFSASIYFYQISGQAKTWLDRMYPMLSGFDFTPRYPNKKFATIYAQGSKDPAIGQKVIDEMNGYFTAFGWENQGTLLSMGSDHDDFVMEEHLMENAFELGQKLGE